MAAAPLPALAATACTRCGAAAGMAGCGRRRVWAALWARVCVYQLCLEWPRIPLVYVAARRLPPPHIWQRRRPVCVQCAARVPGRASLDHGASTTTPTQATLAHLAHTLARTATPPLPALAATACPRCGAAAGTVGWRRRRVWAALWARVCVHPLCLGVPRTPVFGAPYQCPKTAARPM
jgi:hypothetical protein